VRSAPLLSRSSPAGPATGSWLFAARAVLATRLLSLFVAAAANWLLSADPGSPGESGLGIWARWDARHFIEVAAYGYSDPRSDPHSTAFFPLFPLLTRALAATGISYVAAGMLVSTASSIVACAYLHRLAGEELDLETGRRAVLYLLLFPTAVFLVAPYSEALFLAGAVPAFYYARRRRWHLVAAPAAVATGTRAAGVFLLLGLAAEWLRGGRSARVPARRAAIALGIGALPLVGYGIYLEAAVGNAFQFFADQAEGWQRELTNPIAALAATWRGATSDSLDANFVFAFRIEIAAAVLGLGATAWALARREWGYAAYMGSMMAALMTSNYYLSIPRMLLTFWPGLVLLAELNRTSPRRHEVTLVVMIPLAALGVVVFTRGGWFF
jgi:hypothetical protein